MTFKLQITFSGHTYKTSTSVKEKARHIVFTDFKGIMQEEKY